MTIDTGESITLPRSISSNFINGMGVIVFLLAIFYCRNHGIADVESTVYSVFAYGLTVLVLEVVLLRTPARPATGLDFKKFSWNADRIFYKLVGLYGCYAFIGLLYWGLPIYSGDFFKAYHKAMRMTLPYIWVLAVPYVAVVDCFMKEPLDNYYWFGRWLLFRPRGTTWLAFTQLITGWVVKGFFLPLMFIFMVGDVNYLLKLSVSQNNVTFLNVYHPMVSLIFVLDLLAAVAGYLMTFRLFDTHIRSVEPTFFGWFVCLLCYDPFNGTYFSTFLSYRGSEDRWIHWLDSSPDLLIIWGTITYIAIFIYSVAGMNFGIRFSNISYRGTLTNGMYRFTKHPEYVSKNFFWWMTFVPFAHLANDQGGVIETVRFCLLMAGVNLVYFWRARTEERHLSRDPVYVQYALWMNEHGALAWLGRLIPYFKYKAPQGWREFPHPYMGIK